MSSSAPGASPMNIKSACGFPTPNTICLRPCLCSGQRVQSPMSSRISRSPSTGSLTAGATEAGASATLILAIGIGSLIFFNGMSGVRGSRTAIEIVNAKFVVEADTRAESLPKFGIQDLWVDQQLSLRNQVAPGCSLFFATRSQPACAAAPPGPAPAAPLPTCWSRGTPQLRRAQ